MIENRKSTKDTYVTKEIIETIVGQTQMKEVMADKTPMRYALKSMMAGFLLAIVTVFMLAIKTQFASTHIDGLINLLGAIAFSLALVLIVLTNSELLTSNFMYLTVSWYFLHLLTFCLFTSLFFSLAGMLMIVFLYCF